MLFYVDFCLIFSSLLSFLIGSDHYSLIWKSLSDNIGDVDPKEI